MSHALLHVLDLNNLKADIYLLSPIPQTQKQILFNTQTGASTELFDFRHPVQYLIHTESLHDKGQTVF